MSLRRIVATAGLAAGLAVPACGDDGGSAASTTVAPTTTATTDAATTTTTEPEPVEGLLATVATNRLFVTRHAFGLGLRNVGSTPVSVVAVRLDSGLYEPAATGEETVLLQAGGRRFVVPVPYGEPRCGDGVSDAHAVVVTTEDGRELRVPAVEEFPGAIARLHERECFGVDVRERADFRFGDDWTQDGTAITGELLLDQRHTDAPVAVDDVRGNVIFTVIVGRDERPILRVDDDEPSASVPITISADRCDPHAVAEFKQPYVFQSWIAVGDGEPVPVVLEAIGGARTALAELIASCSTG